MKGDETIAVGLYGSRPKQRWAKERVGVSRLPRKSSKGQGLNKNTASIVQSSSFSLLLPVDEKKTLDHNENKEDSAVWKPYGVPLILIISRSLFFKVQRTRNCIRGCTMCYTISLVTNSALLRSLLFENVYLLNDMNSIAKNGPERCDATNSRRL